MTMLWANIAGTQQTSGDPRVFVVIRAFPR
jgi:hypothetical protein